MRKIFLIFFFFGLAFAGNVWATCDDPNGTLSVDKSVVGSSEDFKITINASDDNDVWTLSVCYFDTNNDWKCDEQKCLGKQTQCKKEWTFNARQFKSGFHDFSGTVNDSDNNHGCPGYHQVPTSPSLVSVEVKPAAPLATGISSVTVTGNSFNAGETIPVSWTADSSIKQFCVGLFKVDRQVSGLKCSVTGNTWGLPTSPDLETGSDYRVKVCQMGGSACTAVEKFSDSFTISGKKLQACLELKGQWCPTGYSCFGGFDLTDRANDKTSHPNQICCSGTCESSTKTCSQLVQITSKGGCCQSDETCLKGKTPGASDCIECCVDIKDCQKKSSTPCPSGFCTAYCDEWGAEFHTTNKTCSIPLEKCCELIAPPVTPPSNGGVKPPAGPGIVINLSNPLRVGNLTDLLNALTNFIFRLGIVLAPIMLIIAGFWYVASAGDPGRLETAKKMMFYTIIGLVVLLLARGLVAVIKSILGTQ